MTSFRDPSLNYSGEIPSKAVGIFYSFRCNLRPEVDNHVISGAAVEYVSVDVRVKFGDSRSNGSRDIQGADFMLNERTNISKPIT